MCVHFSCLKWRYLSDFPYRNIYSSEHLFIYYVIYFRITFFNFNFYALLSRSKLYKKLHISNTNGCSDKLFLRVQGCGFRCMHQSTINAISKQLSMWETFFNWLCTVLYHSFHLFFPYELFPLKIIEISHILIRILKLKFLFTSAHFIRCTPIVKLHRQ